MSNAERLMLAEARIRDLATTISEYGGGARANSAALLSLLEWIGQIDEIRATISVRLEQAKANVEGSSTNEPYVQGFQDAMALMLLALDSRKVAPSAQSEQPIAPKKP